MRLGYNALLASLLLATLIVPALPAAAQERAMGMGWNFAGGFSVRKQGNLIGTLASQDLEYDWCGEDICDMEPPLPNLELFNFELRLFPKTDKFSIDMQWNLFSTIVGAATKPLAVPNFTQYTYAHFHTDPDAEAAFAVAPGLILNFGRFTSIIDYVTVGAACRVGGDILKSDKSFGMGIYARPGLFYTDIIGTDSSDYEGIGFELVAELTWTIYALRK